MNINEKWIQIVIDFLHTHLNSWINEGFKCWWLYLIVDEYGFESQRDYLAEIGMIRLIFCRHEENEQSVVELHIFQRWSAHVEEHSIQNWHRNKTEYRRHENRQADHDWNQNQRHSLFPVFQLGMKEFFFKTRRLIISKISDYLTPRNWGFSPGAAHSVWSFSALTWLMERTVAATNHGKPKNDLTMIRIASTNKSKW